MGLPSGHSTARALRQASGLYSHTVHLQELDKHGPFFTHDEA